MTVFATYTGETRARTKGREISEETRALREALGDSAKTGTFKRVPGSNDKKEQAKWTTKIKEAAKLLELKVEIQLTTDNSLAFKATDPNQPVVEPEAEETATRRRASRRK